MPAAVTVQPSPLLPPYMPGSDLTKGTVANSSFQVKYAFKTEKSGDGAILMNPLVPPMNPKGGCAMLYAYFWGGKGGS